MTSRITGYGVGAAKIDLAPVPTQNNGIPTNPNPYDFGQLIQDKNTGDWYIYSGGSTFVNIGGTPGALDTLTGDSGTATPSAGNIQIAGDGTNIVTSASGAAVTVSLASAISVSSVVASGDVSAASVTATGDGGGAASSIQLSNVDSTTISTGVGSVKMSTTNAANNSAWIKIYIGTSAYWIPAWTTNAP